MVKSNKESTMEKKSQLELFINERKSKLIELYCLSRLNNLFSLDSNTLKRDINQFLDYNDLTKNQVFDVNSLPEMKLQDPPFVEKKLPRNKASGQLEIRKIRDVKKRSRDSTPGYLKTNNIPNEKDVRENCIDSNVRRQEKRNLDKTKMTFHDVAEPKGLCDTDNIEKNQHGEKRELELIDDPNELVSQPEKKMKISETKHLPLSSHNVYVPNLHANPTKVDIKCNKHYLIEKIVSDKPMDNTTSFKSNNINSTESVYLVMNEAIPTKLAHAISLAELKYVSQTLPLIKLIPPAHKALNTELINTALNEGRITVVSSRIEELRRLNLWSLRQPKKFMDPFDSTRSITHHSILLEEIKWMREDFHEFKKFKIAVCAEIAQSVMDYWTYGKVCCIKRNPINHLKSETELASYKTDQAHEDENALATINTKLLFKNFNPIKEIIPHKLPNYSLEEYQSLKTRFPVKLRLCLEGLSPLEKNISNNIPLYSGIKNNFTEVKCNEVLPFIPISKSMSFLDNDHFLKLVEKQMIDEEPSLGQLSKKRGMFYGNRRSHYLKPPIAPSLKYLKFRTPTIWLSENDQELVRNINQYAYNWDLISAHMSCKNTRSYTSNIERRTPWQCFERFVQLDEKFTVHDMKGPRAHNAQLWLYETHKLQQQQKRRISPLGVGSDSIQRGHKRLRWASMFDAIRKSIKRRENTPKPNPSLPRKPLDVKNTSVPTPSDMSELKAQRDDALRRDVQIRRVTKQRIQMGHLQQQQIINNRVGGRNVTSTLQNIKESNLRVVRTAQTAPVDHLKSTSQLHQNKSQESPKEKEILENYARNMHTQKPELTPELALKAAEKYYSNISIKQQCQRVQESTSGNVSYSPLSASSANKAVPPTPQEILQKLQK